MSLLSQQLVHAAKAVPTARRAFDNKVFLHHVHAALPIVGMPSLESWKRAIVADADCRAHLSRLDMVRLFPADDVKLASAKLTYDDGYVAAEFHFVRLD